MNPAQPDKSQQERERKELEAIHERKLQLDLDDPRETELPSGIPAHTHEKRELTYEDTDSPRKR